MKCFRTVLCLVILSILFSGTTSAERLSVLVNMRSVTDYIPAWDELVANFKAANPGLEVEVTSGTTEDKLQTMVVANAAPDVVHFDRYLVGTWAQRDLLEPIDSLLQGMDLNKLFLNGPLQEATLRGQLYAVPFDIDIRGLFWNTSQLSEAGLDSIRGPQDWSELSAFASKLTRVTTDGTVSRAGFIPWIGNFQWMGWIWTFGGDYFDPETFRPTINKPQNIQAFEWQASFAERYGTPAILSGAGITSDYFRHFPGGALSMVAAHYHARQRFVQTNPTLQFWGGPVPHPPNGRNGTWSGGYAFVVPKGAKNLSAAAHFLRFVSSPETQVRYYLGTKALPSTTAGISRVTGLAEPLERVFLLQADISKWRHPPTRMFVDIMQAAEREVVNLTKPSAQALEEAQQMVLTKFADFWGKQN